MKELAELAVGDKLLAFSIEGQQFALLLSVVDRVIPSVAITPLPDAPQVIVGVIKLSDEVLPVFNIRKRFGVPSRDIKLSDRMIVAHAGSHLVALWVDTVEDIHEMEADHMVTSDGLLDSLPYVKGVVQVDKDLIIIHDLEEFLSLKEEIELKKALDSTDSDEDD